MKPKQIPNNWWKLLEKVEHQWGDPEPLDCYGETQMVQWCKTCGAMLYVDENYGGSDPHYDSCRITTDWPGDDSPCLCTRRRYLEAHGLL